MQVYRGMDVGTAKPSAAARASVRHHLVDIADPAEPFSVAEFQRKGRAVLRRLRDSGMAAIICGGSGLHFRALVDPLEFPPTDDVVRANLEATAHEELIDELLAADPHAAEHVDMANPRRVLRAVEVHRLTGATPSVRAESTEAESLRQYRPLLDFVGIGLDPGDSLEARVTRRFWEMIEAGWVDEAAGLGTLLGPTAQLAIGYRELRSVPDVGRDVDDVVAAVVQATVAYAKRQRTFFRKDPRIHWIPWHDDAADRLDSAAAVLTEAGVWTL